MKWYFLCLFFFSVNTWAQWNGNFKIKDDSVFEKPEPMVDQNQISSQLELEHGSKWVTGDITNKFKIDFLFAARSSQDADDRYDLIPKDFYWERKSSSWYHRLGLITTNWEGTDGINPMDLFAAKDYRDPFAIQTLPSAALQIGWNGEKQTVEVIYIPWQTDPKLPKSHSVWWPRRTKLPIQSEDTELKIGTSPQYQIDSMNYINEAVRNNYGLRWQIRSDMGDFSFAGFEGANPQPLLLPTLNATLLQVSPKTILLLQSPVEIQPYLYRVRSGAMAYVKTFEKWIARFSGQNIQPMGNDTRNPGWSQLYVLGFERSIEYKSDTVILVLQGSYGLHPQSGGVLTSSSLFDKAMMFGLRWPVGEKQVYAFNSLYEFINNSGYGGIQWTYRYNDQWSSQLGFDVLAGPDDSLLGILSNRSRASLSLTRSF